MFLPPNCPCQHGRPRICYRCVPIKFHSKSVRKLPLAIVVVRRSAFVLPCVSLRDRLLRYEGCSRTRCVCLTCRRSSPGRKLSCFIITLTHSSTAGFISFLLLASAYARRPPLSAVCISALMCREFDSYSRMVTILCERHNIKIIFFFFFFLSYWNLCQQGIVFVFLVVSSMFVAVFFPPLTFVVLFPCGPSRGRKNRNLPQSSCGA